MPTWSRLRPLVFLLPALVLIRCGPTGGTTDDRQVFRYNESEGITSLDPAFARNLEHIWVVDQLFDGLVEMGADMRVRPALARRRRR